MVYKNKTTDVWKAARDVHDLVSKKTRNPQNIYLVLQCYADMQGELQDATFAAARCGYDSKAVNFIGTMFFGLAFIPPASHTMKKTVGVLTVNEKMCMSMAVRE